MQNENATKLIMYIYVLVSSKLPVEIEPLRHGF